MKKKIKDLTFEEIQNYCHGRRTETKKCLSCALNPICNFAQNNSIDGRKNMLVNKGIYKKEFLNQTIKFEQRCPKCNAYIEANKNLDKANYCWHCGQKLK